MATVTDLVNFLKAQIGKPYVLGAIGPDSYDCSGLVYTAYKDVMGVTLARVSTDQYAYGVSVEEAELQIGDLIFFDTGSSARVPNHVGVCIGDGKMIDANSYSNAVVEESYISSYWQNAYYGAKRVLDLATPFSDVPINHQFYEAIISLYDKGVVQGYSDGTFKPEQGINRAEVLKIILEAFEVPLTTSGDSPFSDVQTSDWFFPYVKTAYDKGIIAGYPDGTFKPAQMVNRVECLKMAINTAGITVPQTGIVNYTDVPEGAWFYYYVVCALNNQLIAPISSSEFGSAEDMKRGEMCKVVWVLLK